MLQQYTVKSIFRQGFKNKPIGILPLLNQISLSEFCFPQINLDISPKMPYDDNRLS